MTDLECKLPELYSYPVGSENHKKVLNQIQLELKKKSKMHDFNICFPSKYSRKVTNSRAKKLKEINGLSLVTDHDSFLFSNIKSFVEDKGNFDIIERYKLEYNLMYQQLTVAAYITDGDKIVMLHSKKGRLNGFNTLIQGHVDYSSDCLTMSQSDFLLDNVAREIMEEINIPTETMTKVIKPNIRPKFYMSSKDSLISLEHFGIIYEIRVNEITQDMLISGEPDKHDVVVLKISEVSPENNLDGWAKEIITRLKLENTVSYI